MLPLTEKEAHVLTIVGSAPVAVVPAHGKARVFHLNLGHDAKAISLPGTTQLIRYGSLWAATQMETIQ
jgi:type 1 glutamine amidotransferase